MRDFGDFSALSAHYHWISTILVICLILLLRVLLLRHVRQSPNLAPDIRRRWMVQIRQGAFLLLFFALLMIWASEVKGFALAVVAIAAAIVIATKELLMCLTGSIVKSSGRSFGIGDRIEINEIRGDVFDQGLLTTTLLEIGPGRGSHQHTGRTIVIPNSLFLTTSVVNETFTDDYVLHAFTIPLQIKDDWQTARRRLLELATEQCAAYLEDARSHMEQIGKNQGITALSVEPRVTLHLPEPERINLLVRLPAPARRRGRIEQAILAKFCEELPALTASHPVPLPATRPSHLDKPF